LVVVKILPFDKKMISRQNYYTHGRIERSNEEFEFEFDVEVTTVSEKGLLEDIRRC